MTKEQLEALGRKIESLEQEMSRITAVAVEQTRGFSVQENERLSAVKAEHAGLVEVMRAAKAMPTTMPAQTAPAQQATTPAAAVPDAQIAARATAAEQQRAAGTVAAEVNTHEFKPFRNMGEQMRAIIAAGKNTHLPVDERLTRLHNWYEQERAATGMGENVPSDGGFLLQKDFSNQLQDSLYETGTLLGLTKKLPLSGNSNGTEVLVLDETSRATGSRLGGVQVYWGNEGDAVTASKAKLRIVKMELLKMFAAVYLTEEVSQDAAQLEAFMMNAFADEMGYVIDDMILNGNGAGRPLGVLHASNPSLVTVSKESGQSADTFNFQNALNMRSRMPGRKRKNAFWAANQELEPTFPQFTLLGGTSSPGIYQVGSVADGVPTDRLFGYPIKILEQMSGIGDLNDIAFINLDNYLTIEKGGLKSASSIHVRFMQGENVIRFMQRWNGVPLDNSAITPAKGTKTLSNYINLEAR